MASMDLSACVAAAAATSLALAVPQGDECATPLPVSGSTSVPYDPANFTTSSTQLFAPCVPEASPEFVRDMWICWTADCTGVATFDLCGGPPGGGTRMEMWLGCGCPTTNPAGGGTNVPLCCSDSDCGLHAFMACEVVCGNSYLVRIGLDPGEPPDARTLVITCAGSACPPGPDPFGPGRECGGCCQGVPTVAGFGGPVLLSTDAGDDAGAFVLHAFDISAFATAGSGYWSPPRYEHPSWTQAALGGVFGVTVDGAGDIYLARTSIYPFAGTGSLGGGRGSVIRIDGTTGAASILVTLPQSSQTDGPGLGNLTWDCGHSSLYATNFEDGRVYRIDPSAAPAQRVKSAWDFASDALDLSGQPEAGDALGWAAKGQRIWGVAVSGDRLFVSVWSRDLANPGGYPNSIWSVSLDGAGDPVPGTKALEMLLNGAGVLPSPVSDLAFNGECCLYAAQRSMFDAMTGAHQSDLLKFCWHAEQPGAWAQDATFRVGDDSLVGLDRSCAGGVGVDDATGGWVWSTGDLLLANPLTYGVQGTPQSGGSTSNSLVIDNDDDSFTQPQGDKTRQGSCEVICVIGVPPREPCSVEVDEVHCLLGPDGYPSGEYSVTVTVHNDSGQTVNLLLLPTLGTFQYLDPPLQTGHSVTLKVVVSGNAGDLISIPIGLFDGTTHCCGVKAEFVLPVCTCVLFTEVTVSCHPDGDPTTYQYDISFTLHNISTNPSFIATWFFLLPPPGAPYFFTPTVGNVFPLLPGGQTSVGPIALSFTVPPVAGPNGQWQLVVPVSLHNANLAICCDSVLVLHGPIPCEPSCSPDLSGDGIVNGADLGILLGAWGPGGAGTCADLNGDGVVNGNDLGVLLGAWS